MPDYDQIEEEEMPNYFERSRKANKIFALWCTKEEYSWAYETRIPHSKFVLTDNNNNNDKYCEGIVFELSGLKQKS